jgi:E3 ubiquitin-protein ligase BRE1
VLESELRRHKAQLAANVGNDDLMLFFADGNTENAAYLENLRNRLTSVSAFARRFHLNIPYSAAEDRAAALEQSLSHFQSDQPNIVKHVKAEAEVRQQLSEVEAQLEKYKAVYGDPSTLPPDVSKLAERLQQKEDENQRLRLLDTQRSQVCRSFWAIAVVLALNDDVPGGDFALC